MGRVTTTERGIKIAFRYSRNGPARFMGHLDLMRAFQKAARRAGVPLAHSEGFNPHPKMTIASPLPVGAIGRSELAAFELSKTFEPGDMLTLMNGCLPQGVRIEQVWEVDNKRGTFGARMESEWGVRVRLQTESAGSDISLQNAVDDVMRASEIWAVRHDGRSRDVRTHIIDVQVEEFLGQEAVIRMMLIQTEKLGARPQDVVNALTEHIGPLEIVCLERRMLVSEFNSLPDTSRVLGEKGNRAEGGENNWRKS